MSSTFAIVEHTKHVHSNFCFGRGYAFIARSPTIFSAYANGISAILIADIPCMAYAALEAGDIDEDHKDHL